jgi:hypothetical protein
VAIELDVRWIRRRRCGRRPVCAAPVCVRAQPSTRRRDGGRGRFRSRRWRSAHTGSTSSPSGCRAARATSGPRGRCSVLRRRRRGRSHAAACRRPDYDPGLKVLPSCSGEIRSTDRRSELQELSRALFRTRTVDPLSMKKGRASSDWVVHRPVRAGAPVVGVELGSSLYRLLVGEDKADWSSLRWRISLRAVRRPGGRWRLWERRVRRG